MPHCVEVVGLNSLTLTGITLTVSCIAPFWLFVKEEGGKTTKDYGLIAACEHHEGKTNCTWDLVDNGSPFSTLDWFRATQGLMAVGLGLALVALVIASLSLSSCCHRNCSGVIIGLLITCFLSVTVAVALFGIKATQDYEASVVTGADNSTSSYTFGWSFWLGVAAAGMSLSTSSVYGSVLRKSSGGVDM